MKTHAFARALQKVASALKALPDMEVDRFLNGTPTPHLSVAESKVDALAVNVVTLAGLSRISKDEWKRLIAYWNLPIDVLTKDSARNIMGDVMRYLEKHPDELTRIQHGLNSRGSKASPELMKALSILMASGNNEDSREGN